MTRKHFEAMAALVRDILAGNRQDTSAVTWVDSERYQGGDITQTTWIDTVRYREACIVAHAFVSLGLASNPRFNERRFLVACGLVG